MNATKRKPKGSVRQIRLVLPDTYQPEQIDWVESLESIARAVHNSETVLHSPGHSYSITNHENKRS